ncbi:Phospholipase C [Steccherinum ochraceum]|uniref:Phosphoinositide phospholipase C n=1 Tax=Steccherinum ochraceum TaxID=92696 RepID=A0A4R0R0S1_9APHY|nr:Phospholipase C [Steccherinum ochraceum]
MLTHVDVIPLVQSTLSDVELKRVFVKYAVATVNGKVVQSSPDEAVSQNPLDMAVKGAMAQGIASPPTPAPLAVPSVSIASQSPPSPTSSPAESQVTWETGILTVKGLMSFLMSTDNSAFLDQNGKVYHDMTRPLPEYFISSSHNTYLVGHQLVGDSTIEGYIRALLHSCRSVELDIYDGDREPVVYHGRTLTTKVSLRDACKAIAKYAFVASPYPIIISAEVHCGLVQQALMADIMRDVFGDALISAPVDGRPKIDALPSPNELKGRVLLKAKNLYVSEHEGIQEKGVTVDTESSSTSTEASASDSDVSGVKDEVKQEWRKARQTETEMIKDLKSEFKKARSVLTRVSSVRTSRRNSSSGLVGSPPKPTLAPSNTDVAKAQKDKVKMSFELVALLVYTVGVKCRGINKKEVYAPEHVFSLSENTANRILKQGMMDLIKHNRTHLVRTYPKGMRIGSTNYEPHRYWSAGCQLVALNWQTFDLGYMINHAMFQRNGRAGYVLKPLALRGGDKQLLSKRTKHYLDIKIISAQQLPRPKDSLGREIIDKSVLDPFVEISIHIPDWTHSPFLPSTDPDGKTPDPEYSPASGGSLTGATSARTLTVKTGAVKNNGFNPVWEQSISLPFDCVGEMMDLIFVRFAVKQEDKDDDEPLAVYCVSLGSLNLGYRHLPLHDAQLSQYLFSTLFVKVDIRDV